MGLPFFVVVVFFLHPTRLSFLSHPLLELFSFLFYFLVVSCFFLVLFSFLLFSFVVFTLTPYLPTPPLPAGSGELKDPPRWVLRSFAALRRSCGVSRAFVSCGTPQPNWKECQALRKPHHRRTGGGVES